MAAVTATDNEKIVQEFAATDADLVPDGSEAAITVTFQDAAGGDLGKWITATADPVDPLKFSYVRKPNTDGTQPATIDFSAVGTATIGGQAITIKTDDLHFVPGVPSQLTATTAVEPLAAA